MVIMRLEAIMEGVSLYLSDRYTTSAMPLWMISLAHSLHGNRAT
mgnify:CR=1 FL=1